MREPTVGSLTSPRRVASVAAVARRHASVRSVWFINSVRGALALAAAVAVADLSSVQHGFWVVLGTLSVLRTNAASTGSTALRALGGTAIGFVIGGALLVAIGTSSTALWVALPIAVFVAAYAPGTAPFAVGQAAFTVTVAVLFNLLVPVGWKVGVRADRGRRDRLRGQRRWSASCSGRAASRRSSATISPTPSARAPPT